MLASLTLIEHSRWENEESPPIQIQRIDRLLVLVSQQREDVHVRCAARFRIHLACNRVPLTRLSNGVDGA